MGQTTQRQRHWEDVYSHRAATEMSWYQPSARISLDFITLLGVAIDDAVVDVGGGASSLAGDLLARGFQDMTVLDISGVALDTARARLAGGAGVHWVCEDVLAWHPERRYRLWHDRALLHFMLGDDEREGYLHTLRSALAPGGAVILATFAPDGPDSCSGLPVARYAADDLAALLGDEFDVIESRREAHGTPSGGIQAFTWIAARHMAV